MWFKNTYKGAVSFYNIITLLQPMKCLDHTDCKLNWFLSFISLIIIQMLAFGCFLRKNLTIFSESSQIQFLALKNLRFGYKNILKTSTCNTHCHATLSRHCTNYWALKQLRLSERSQRSEFPPHSPAMQASTVTPDLWRRYSALSGWGTSWDTNWER